MGLQEHVGRAHRALALLAGMASLLAAGSRALADRPVAGSVTPERLKVPSGPSSVRGLADEPQVDAFNAQLNYQVPIELPNGLGGLTPSLALTYSGTLGNAVTNVAMRYWVELSAFWIEARFRDLPAGERAATIRDHILANYEYFARLYRTDPTFHRFVDNVNRPPKLRNATNE